MHGAREALDTKHTAYKPIASKSRKKKNFYFIYMLRVEGNNKSFVFHFIYALSSESNMFIYMLI